MNEPWLSTSRSISDTLSGLATHVMSSCVLPLFAMIWSPLLWGSRFCHPKERRSFPTQAWFVLNEPRRRSRRPGDVGPRLVAARDPCHDRLVQVRGELRNLGREVDDGVADCPGHVEARLLGRRTGPPWPAAQSRGPLELCDQRVALGAPLCLPLGVAVDRGVVQLVV